MRAPSTAMEAGVAAVGVAALALFAGFLLSLAVARLSRARADPVLCLGLAPVALIGFVLCVALAHAATGGAILTSPTLTAAITATVLAVAVIVAIVRRREGSSGKGLWLVLLALAVGLVAWGTPVFVQFPQLIGGDMPWHLAYAGQLIDGRPLPTSWMAGSFPNDYPWLFHAVLAFFARFTPGGRAIHALGPLQIFLVLGSLATLFALGREATGRAIGGLMTAVAAGICGGIGFLVTGPHAPRLADPRSLADVEAYLGDFVRFRSYNIAFHHLSPPFQRDLSFVLLQAFLLLVLLAIKRKSAGALLCAGVTVGMLGLTGGEATFVAFGVAAILLIAGMGLSRLRVVALLFAPGLAIYAIWLVPLMVNYFRYGGFRDQSAALAVYPPLSIAGAWGLTLLLGIYGVIRFLPRARERNFGIFAVFAGAAVGSLALATVGARLLGPGVQTLGRTHRYWPLVHLALALYAGLGAAELLQKLARFKPVAFAAAAFFIAVATASPLLASEAVSRVAVQQPLREAVRNGARTVLNHLSPEPGGDCVVAAPGLRLPDQIASFAGYRLVDIWRPPRWPGALGPRGRQRRRLDNALLTTARTPPANWERLVRRYAVDVVVTQAPPAVTRVLPGIRARTETQGYRLLWLHPGCAR